MLPWQPEEPHSSTYALSKISKHLAPTGKTIIKVNQNGISNWQCLWTFQRCSRIRIRNPVASWHSHGASCCENLPQAAAHGRIPVRWLISPTAKACRSWTELWQWHAVRVQTFSKQKRSPSHMYNKRIWSKERILEIIYDEKIDQNRNSLTHIEVQLWNSRGCGRCITTSSAHSVLAAKFEANTNFGWACHHIKISTTHYRNW